MVGVNYSMGLWRRFGVGHPATSQLAAHRTISAYAGRAVRNTRGISRRQGRYLTSALYLGACLAGVGPASPGVGVWGPSHGPGGGYTSRHLSWTPENPKTVYAGTVGGGVFKSTDGAGKLASSERRLGGRVVNALASRSQKAGHRLRSHRQRRLQEHGRRPPLAHRERGSDGRVCPSARDRPAKAGDPSAGRFPRRCLQKHERRWQLAACQHGYRGTDM